MCVGIAGQAKNVVDQTPIAGSVTNQLPDDLKKKSIQDFRSNMSKKLQSVPGVAGFAVKGVQKNDNMLSTTGIM